MEIKRRNWFWVDSEHSLRNTMPSIIQRDEENSLVINSSNAYIENNSIYLNQYIFKTNSVIGRRMFDYYPLVIQIIIDFQSIISSEFPEFEMAWQANDNVLSNAFLTTMGESRIEEWETILNLTHDEDDTIEMRRDAIIARIRGQGKLNTESINSIVNVFTGGTARSYIENSTLYVWITLPQNNKVYKFKALEYELSRRTPAHLGIQVNRVAQTWKSVKDVHATWNAASETYDTWNDAIYDIH